MKLGLCRLPRDLPEFLEYAQIADQAGFWGLGVGDSPYLYNDLYPAATAALLRTERVRVGPFVSNFVARHWAIHAASARAHEALAPGRSFLGVGTGDGAVYSIGHKAQRWSDLEADVGQFRARSPETVPVHVAVSGPTGAQVAGRSADAVVIAVGAEAAAIGHLARVARESAAPDQAPAQTWVMLPTYVVEDADELPYAQAMMSTVAIAFARFAFSFTFDGKFVPAEYEEPLRQALAAYTHQHHASQAADNPNAALLSDFPEVRDYVLDRMVLVGTRDECAERLADLHDVTGVDGFWLTVTAPNGPAVARRIAEALSPWLE